MNLSEVEKLLKKGGIGVLPTDTVYGVVGSALSKKAVERIYKVRQRRSDKPFIILISSFADFNRFDIPLKRRMIHLWKKIIPCNVSIILPCKSKKFYYLHRGKNTLAFRIPHNARLKKLIARTGPLVAPSANIEGSPPAKTIREAKRYFLHSIDFYYNRGRINKKPSIILELKRE